MMMMITPRSSHVAKRRREDNNNNKRSSTFIGVSLHSTDSIVFEDSEAGDSCSGSYGTKPKCLEPPQNYIDQKVTNTNRLPPPPRRKASKMNDTAWFTLSGSSISDLSKKKLEKKSVVPAVVAVKDDSRPEKQRQEQTSPRRKPREFTSKVDNRHRITKSKALDQRKRQTEKHRNLSDIEREAREREAVLIRKLQDSNGNRSDDKGMETALSKRPLHKEDNNDTNDADFEQMTTSTASLSATIDTERTSAASSMTSTEITVRRRAEAWEQKIRAMACRDSKVVKSNIPPKPRNSFQTKTFVHSNNTIPKNLQSPKIEVVNHETSPKTPSRVQKESKSIDHANLTPKLKSPKIEVVDREAWPQILYEIDEKDIACSECSEDANYVPKYLQSPKKSVQDRIPPALVLFESDREETESSESSYEDIYDTPKSLRSHKTVDYNRLPEILFASDREETEYTEEDSELDVIEAPKFRKEQHTTVSPPKKRTRKIPAEIVIHTEDDTSTTCESTRSESQHCASENTAEESEDETEVSKSFIVSLKGFADSDYEPRPTIEQTRKSMRDISLKLEKIDPPPAKPMRRQLVPYPPAIQQDLESGVINDDSDDDKRIESVKSDHFGDFALWRSAELANDAKRAGKRMKQRMIAVSIILLVAFGLILCVILDPLQKWGQR